MISDPRAPGQIFSVYEAVWRPYPEELSPRVPHFLGSETAAESVCRPLAARSRSARCPRCCVHYLVLAHAVVVAAPGYGTRLSLEAHNCPARRNVLSEASHIVRL